MSIDKISALQQITAGNKVIIKQMYQEVFPKIKSFVLKNSGGTADAEDIFQKALMQLIARYKTKPFTIESSFEAYLFGVCRNLWLREINKQKRMVTNDNVIELNREEEDMTMAALEQEKWELFQEKLTMISDKCKQLLLLFFKKIPRKDIATQLGYNSDNVVRQRIFNCKSQLTKAIQKDDRYHQLKEL